MGFRVLGWGGLGIWVLGFWGFCLNNKSKKDSSSLEFILGHCSRSQNHTEKWKKSSRSWQNHSNAWVGRQAGR